MARLATALPLTAQHGTCGVTLMPGDRIIATAGGRFLVLDSREAHDLHAALGDLQAQVDAINARDAA
jgi:hypothetical protein